ncbi:MAG: GNAT family N-acetyltransferase [Desulforhabdus sp.]|jgi:ribosomal protein S18 acetylase RimI-like enzyme|nr:GNAT family N-acetyltransferase [Desulforhabdus sp.]
MDSRSVDIRLLQSLSRVELDEINRGYTSDARYFIRKTETTQCTTISLDYEPLEQPYSKSWNSDDEELNRYQQAAGMGYSLGAYNGQKLVGISLSEPQLWNRSLWVWEFHISEAYRGRGLGRRLMDAQAKLAQEKGLRVLVCETQNYNVPAIHFYRSVGFEVGGVDLSYYSNTDLENGEVAIFMKRKI